MSGQIVFFDLETSGLDPMCHEVIQLAAIAIEEVGDGFRVLDKFERKLRFDVSAASPEALAVNSYSESAWQSAIPRGQAVAEFSRFLRDHSTVEQISQRTGRPYKVAQLAGHNIASFDVPFLRQMFGSEFCPIRFIPLDTLQLAAWVMDRRPDGPKDLKLATLAEHFGIAFEGEAHDALADVEVNVKVTWELLRLFGIFEKGGDA